jgi:hypothetical protein
MARTAKSPKAKTTPSTKKLASKATKPTRVPAPVQEGSKKSKPAVTPKQAKSTITAKAPKLSVAELRVQVEKLERTNATLRTKGREAGRAATTATARIAELEGVVASLEKKLAKTSAPEKSSPPPTGRAKRKSREIDTGDAAPASLPVEEPANSDDGDATAGEN